MSGLLTGQAPSRIGTHRDNLSERAITVAELLHTAGYETIGVSDNYLTCADVGFGQGHERYYCTNNQRLFRSMFVYRYLPERFKRWAARDLRLLYQGAETVGVVAERFLIERDPTRPFYLLIHYMDVHYPFYVYRGDAGNVSNLSMPESFVPYYDILLAMEEQPRPPFSSFQLPRDQVTDLQHRYLGGVQHLDAWIGRLFEQLQALGVWDETLVIFTADHGEEFFEHRFFSHGASLYQESIRVPLVVKWPGAERNSVTV